MAAALVATALGVAGCGSSSSETSNTANQIPAFNPSQKVTITYWVPFTGRELEYVRDVIKGFEKAYPNVKVNTVGNINDEKIIAAVRSGNVPDAALSFTTDNTGVFCRSGTFVTLGPQIDKEHIDVNDFPPAQREYTEYKGTRCVLPAMADAYGLYYNKRMFAKAGISSPPKTMSELTEDAKKLTVKSGSTITTVGYTPYFGFYENAAAHYGPLYDANWVLSNGKSAIGTDPGWKELAEWNKNLIDYYGLSPLVRFQTGAGGEFTSSNAFQTEKVAMEIDGEWRTALIRQEAPKLEYGTAPMPTSDNHTNVYGGGYTTGNITGIPKGSPHPAAAWELIKYLATNDKAQDELAKDLGNLPTWIPALPQAKAEASPQFLTFLKIASNANTTTTPIVPSGETNQQLLERYLEKYQAGQGGNLEQGLKQVAAEIDAAEAQATAGSTP
ncbi:MAG TPA: ABC transporter substrate-binding protein [Solirubrobacteraceae bacterium]|nr:ABC transporter substrate-binding protein [Solirubrobacteraceae bacterium]